MWKIVGASKASVLYIYIDNNNNNNNNNNNKFNNWGGGFNLWTSSLKTSRGVSS